MSGPSSPARPRVSATGAPSNWDRSLDLMTRRGVPERARQWYMHRVEEFARSQPPVAGPRFSRSAEGFPLLETLARRIRAMQYSIRTEQAHVDWRRRFPAFCGDAPAERRGWRE